MYTRGPSHHNDHDGYYGYHDRHYHYHRHYHRVPIKSPKGFILIGIVILIFTSLIACAFLFTTNIFKTEGYVETKGIIVDETSHFDYESGYMYSPIAEFEVNGEKYLVKSDSASSTPSFIGREVTIEYNVNNPKDARFKQNTTLLRFLAIPIILIIMAAGVSLIVVGIKKLRNKDNEEVV